MKYEVSLCKAFKVDADCPNKAGVEAIKQLVELIEEWDASPYEGEDDLLKEFLFRVKKVK